MMAIVNDIYNINLMGQIQLEVYVINIKEHYTHIGKLCLYITSSYCNFLDA